MNEYWTPTPPALVHGYAARALALYLRHGLSAGHFDMLPFDGREQVVRAVGGIERAGEAWMAARGSVNGTTEAVGTEAGASWTHDEISCDEAAGLLGVTPRRIRTLAASGLGRKVGGRWILDLPAVLAEVERRAAA